MNAAELAERLGGAKNGRGYKAKCPAHADSNPSLSIADGKDGKVVFKCHAGCSQDAVINALVRLGLWSERSSSDGQGRYSVTGCTLQQLADAKHLEIDYLRSLGLEDLRVRGVTRVKIPYCDSTGTVTAIHYRLSLEKTGQRFIWRKGDHANLYGLDRRASIRSTGWVLLVEGESDCWTLWQHGLPALGMPGKSTWKSSWAAELAGLDMYLWQEPDAPELPARIAADMPGLKVIKAPDAYKDISEAHILGEDVPALIDRLKANAVAFAVMRRETASAHLAALEEQAAPVLAHPDPLELVEKAIRALGYGGDIKLPVIVYGAATSRLLELRPGNMPVHLLLKGPASSGKSYTVIVVRRLLPEDACHVIDAGSPRVLIYDDASLEHRVLIFGEADSLPSGEDNPAASAVRNLLQDNFLHYKTVVREEETGKFTVQDILRPGPTTLITTAVRSLGEQLMTRLFTLEVTGDPSQYRAALTAQADLELDGTGEPDPALVAYQAYLQARAPWSVVVPFARPLAHSIGQSIAAPRILRDYARLLSLVKAVAVLRHRHRRTDAAGRIVATVEDYSYVRNLVGQMYSETVGGLSEAARAVVDAVARLTADAQPGKKITVTALAEALGISKMSASRRVTSAIRGGYLVNEETRKRYPAVLKLGEPLPDRYGLPAPESLDFSPLPDDCNTLTAMTGREGTPLSSEREMAEKQDGEPSSSVSGVALLHPMEEPGNLLEFTV
jgi:hypothetical protein